MVLGLRSSIIPLLIALYQQLYNTIIQSVYQKLSVNYSLVYGPLKINLVMSFVMSLWYLSLPPGFLELQDLTFPRHPLNSYPHSGCIKSNVEITSIYGIRVHYNRGDQSRDTHLVISHFCACFRLDWRYVKRFFVFFFYRFQRRHWVQSTPALQRIILSLTDFNVNV